MLNLTNMLGVAMSGRLGLGDVQAGFLTFRATVEAVIVAVTTLIFYSL